MTYNNSMESFTNLLASNQNTRSATTASHFKSTERPEIYNSMVQHESMQPYEETSAEINQSEIVLNPDPFNFYNDADSVPDKNSSYRPTTVKSLQ